MIMNRNDFITLIYSPIDPVIWADSRFAVGLLGLDIHHVNGNDGVVTSLTYVKAMMPEQKQARTILVLEDLATYVDEIGSYRMEFMCNQGCRANDYQAIQYILKRYINPIRVKYELDPIRLNVHESK